MQDSVGDQRFVREDDFRLGTQTFQDQFAQVFAGLAKGGFVATWIGEDGFNDYGIRAQLYDTNGEPIGSEFAVNDHTDRVQSEPSVTALAGGGFVVTWSDETAYPAVFDIRAQIYDATGAEVGSAFTVNTTLRGFQTQSQVVALADGGFAVAWQQGNDTSGDDVRTRAFAADGTPVSEERIVIGRPGDVYFSGMAALTGGGYVVSWSDYGVAQDEYGNFLPGSRAQLLDASGKPVGDAFTLEDFEPGNQTWSRLAELPGGGFVAVWSDDGSDFGDPTEHGGLWVQAFDAAGGRVGASVRVTDYPGLSDIAVLPDGTLVLTWTGGYNSGHRELQAQLLDPQGHLLGGSFQVNPGTTSQEAYASVGALADGSFVIGWAETALNSSDEDVHARLFDPITRGGEGRDTMTGTHARDFLAGLGGTDTIDGAGGDDWLAGGGGRDALTGGTGNDRLYGDAGADAVDGGRGADVIEGGSGIDRLTGGAGGDLFVFARGEAGRTAASADLITDFGRGDHIDLSAIDAVRGNDTTDAFTFIGTHAFSGTAGELRYEIVGDETLVTGDINGDGVADLAIRLTGSVKLTAADFVLAAAPTTLAPLGHDLGDQHPLWSHGHDVPVTLALA